MINKIVITSIWFFMVVVILILCPTVNSISDDDMNKMRSGLEAGESIAGLLGDRKFGKSLSKIATGVGPYLGAIGAFVGLISAFNPSESAELAYMKTMMKAIDRRLDLFDYRFDSIERQIRWIITQVNFGQIELKIIAMSLEFKHLYKVPPTAVKNRKSIFIELYDSNYQNSGMTLYLLIVNHSRVFQDLGTAVMTYTEYDRKKTQIFLLGVMQLLLQAAKLEIAYYTAKKYYDNANYLKSTWTNRIQEVRQKFEHIDKQCMDMYHSQSGKDIAQFSLEHKGIGNQFFAIRLWMMLWLKYYWRDWIVVAYDPVRGYQHHTVGVSGGYVIFRTNGRNLLVASVDKRQSVMNLSRAEQQMKNVSIKFQLRFWWSMNYSAEHIFRSLDRTGATLVSVIRCSANVGMMSNASRLKRLRGCPSSFDLIMWG